MPSGNNQEQKPEGVLINFFPWHGKLLVSEYKVAPTSLPYYHPARKRCKKLEAI